MWLTFWNFKSSSEQTSYRIKLLEENILQEITLPHVLLQLKVSAFVQNVSVKVYTYMQVSLMRVCKYLSQSVRRENPSRVFQKQKKKQNTWRDWVSWLNSGLSLYNRLPVVEKCLEKFLFRYSVHLVKKKLITSENMFSVLFPVNLDLQWEKYGSFFLPI